jgi:dTDP-4-dehydrorhamnose reductase
MRGNISKTLILGGGGFLGRYFSKILGNTALVHTRAKLTGISNSVEVDIQTEGDIYKLLTEFEICKVINCMAMTNIEECETNPELAKWVNAEIPAIVAKYTSAHTIQNVFISTDAVLESKSILRTEEAPTFGGSVYSRTKLKGEEVSLMYNSKSLIARVNFFGSSPKKNSLFEYFYTNLKAGNQVVGYDNIFFTTMYAEDTALNCLKLIDGDFTGIFHIVGSERLNKYSFGQIVEKELGLVELVISQKAEENFMRLRSEELSLDNSKLKATLGQIPTIYEGINRALVEIERR